MHARGYFVNVFLIIGCGKKKKTDKDKLRKQLSSSV